MNGLLQGKEDAKVDFSAQVSSILATRRKETHGIRHHEEELQKREGSCKEPKEHSTLRSLLRRCLEMKRWGAVSVKILVTAKMKSRHLTVVDVELGGTLEGGDEGKISNVVELKLSPTVEELKDQQLQRA